MNNFATSATPAGARADVPHASSRGVVAGPPSTLKALKTAMRDHKAAQCRNADEAFVARVNDRTDCAYGLPVTTAAEADAMMRLLIASDGDDLAAPVLEALKGIAAFLKGAAAA